MLAANSWRVAVNADAASASRLMRHLQALETTRGALRPHAHEPQRAVRPARAQSSLPEPVIAALIGVSSTEMWDIRNRGVTDRGAAARSCLCRRRRQ